MDKALLTQEAKRAYIARLVNTLSRRDITQSQADSYAKALARIESNIDRIFPEEVAGPGADDPDHDPTECPIQFPEGLRWHEPEIGIYVSPAIARDDRNLIVEEINELIRVVHKYTNLKIKYERSATRAHIKGVSYAEIDGRGRTLGETRYQFTGDRMLAAWIVCDSEDRKADTDAEQRTKWKHEFAHALGVPHLTAEIAELLKLPASFDIEKALMWPARNIVNGYDLAAVLEYQRRYGKKQVFA